MNNTAIKNQEYSAKAESEYNINQWVETIASNLTPVWPLETYIATNPVSCFENQPFEEALEKSPGYWNQCQTTDELSRVNREMIKWCGAFLDIGQGTIHMPHRDKGFLKGFLSLVIHDNELHLGLKKYKDWLQNLPDAPVEVIQHCLKKLNVPQNRHEEFLSESLSYLPGWAGYVKWRSEQDSSNQPVRLIDFLAVRLILTVIIWPDASKKKNNPMIFELKKIMGDMKRAEKQYAEILLKQLKLQLEQDHNKTLKKEVQAVFCIDVRSEPLRRLLEQQPTIETFGFAGFFGLPGRFKSYGDPKSKDCLPALIKPQFQIEESLCPTEKNRVKYAEKINTVRQYLYSSITELKNQASSSFSWIEAAGAGYGLLMLAKTLVPGFYHRLFKNNRAFKTIFNLEKPIAGLLLKDQINYAASALKLMGLTENFAKTVIFCGHDSTTENNPYASALKCGACGGHDGLLNARLLAAILNRETVRQELKQENIHIPEDTFFIAAVHDTCTNTISIDETVEYSSEQKENVENFIKIAGKAKVQLSHQQYKALQAPLKTMHLKSIDWSEVRPEWGLAGNASMIIGPRAVSQSLNLNGRSFLHSYQWENDKDGKLLETILTAPMVVAHWINCQYLFSSIDNIAFGSGDKVTHNVIGGFGIMQGNGSDLMMGLPLQSVAYNENKNFHSPQRLLTIVYAPRKRVEQIIQRQPKLQRLFHNGWVLLKVMDTEDNRFYQFLRSGQWEAV